MSKQITMYATAVCPFCVRAEQLLEREGVDELNLIRVDLQPERKQEMITLTGRRTVPQIFIGDYHVGGCDELEDLLRDGKFETLLADDEQ